MSRAGNRRGGKRGWPPLADPCAYCGGPSDTYDHIESFGNGGLDTWHNLTAACKGCNGRKGRRSVLAFLLDMPDPFTADLLALPKHLRSDFGRWMMQERRKQARPARSKRKKVLVVEKTLYPQPSLLKILRHRLITEAVAKYRAEKQARKGSAA